ncbi:unnamed protein product [Cuscuta campestris]|uniref:Dipeptidylpeptidase IV N-terminal domain-containing protein n=1 Tax=Cuscuta campestris TaxID=132261 RepID=A0A484LCK8_9ASTE|nr:unnamed protein product [Cuscuta campestris]
MDPRGTVVFATVGRPQYGFDIFSVQPDSARPTERRLTDGVSVNFNGQFLDEGEALVFVSERSGSSQIYLQPNSSHVGKLEQLLSPSDSLFHDRPLIKNDGRLLYISAHEPPAEPFKSWSALYSTDLRQRKITRLTPYGAADFSPSVSQSGKFIAVASYGSRPWGGEFHDLQTDIVVFSDSDPAERIILCPHGGWPQWSGDSTVYFHRQADDGWWSIFKVDLPEGFKPSDYSNQNSYAAAPVRVTPPGLHCFTPAAMHNSSRIATATRRRGSKYRHIEIFDVESGEFYPVTELLNPKCNHYSPFLSPESTVLGYHRFRGESSDIIPHLDPVTSPVKDLRLLRLNGSFPSFSPSGDFILSSGDLEPDSSLLPALSIASSDGSKRWTLLKDRMAFGNSWSPTEPGVIFTSIGPIFESVKAPVQIARVTFDPQDLTDDSLENIIPTDIKILTRESSGNNAFPSCSPDGKLVVFRSGHSGHKNLFVIDSSNGEFEGGIRQLTDGPWIDTMPSWSPDGSLIAFSSNRHNPGDATRFSIYVIRPDGTGLCRIHVAGPPPPPEGSSSPEYEMNDRERLNHVCFSSDGEWLLFTANLGGLTAEPVSLPHQFQPYGDLYMVRLDGTALQRLTLNGYENGTPAWHPKVADDSGRKSAGQKLIGHFDEPTWITFDL